jgi:hypothetical protein
MRSTSIGSVKFDCVGGGVDAMLILPVLWICLRASYTEAVACFWISNALSRLLRFHEPPCDTVSYYHHLCTILTSRSSSYFRLIAAVKLLRSSSMAAPDAISIFVLISILSPAKSGITARAPGVLATRPM